jgi:hypothetical protein
LLFNLSKFGEYHLERGAFEAAKTTFQECLILLEPKVENTARVRITASIHWGMARALTNQGDGEQAREHGQKSLALFQSLKDDRAKEVTQWLYQEGNQYFTGAKSKPGIVDGKDIDHHQ